MILAPQAPSLPKPSLQGRLLLLAAIVLLIYSLILTLAPSVRLHSWQVEYRWQHWIGFTVWLIGFRLVYNQVRRLLPESDPYLLPVAALLTGWGLLTIWRLDNNLGLRQTIWLGLSLLALWLILKFPRTLVILRRYKYLWLIGSLGLTALTFFIGTYPGGNGPRLWLGCCTVYLQPSEPLKLMVIAYLAAYLADRLPVNLSLIKLLLPSLVMTSAAFGILVAQRDLGTATLMIVLYAAIVFQATGKKRVLFISAALVCIAALVSYQLIDVIRLRVDAWLNPWLDPSGRSYQIVQSLLAVAEGGVGGSGAGLGNPGVVPVIASDFIYVAISEETGLIGSIALLLLIGLLASRGLLSSLRATSLYQRYLSAGIVVFLVFQSILIIAGNLRALPLTGVTLPFVSYGGSSLLTSYFCLGFLLLTSVKTEDNPPLLPQSKPILLTGIGLVTSLMILAMFSGYWALIRGDELLKRDDNPRWTISDRYVLRGSILDRKNEIIVQTVGQPGNYQRQLLYPPLGAIIGYTSALYGKAGLESSLDDYLRGTTGNPSSTVVLNHLLFSQTPPGVNVRLSLDLRMQTKADSFMQANRGALVLLNAQTGEILAMTTRPTYDPNSLEQRWAEWIQDPQGIFLNRATQGQYPLGGAIGPFLLAESSAFGLLPTPKFDSFTIFNQVPWTCAFPISSNPGWGEVIANGCPGSRLELGGQFRAEQWGNLYVRLGFTESPNLELPVSPAGGIPQSSDTTSLVLGQTELNVSPLQVALAAAMISANGTRPTSRIAAAIQSPQQGWIALSGVPKPIVNPQLPGATSAAHQLQIGSLPIWQSVSTAQSASSTISWYVAGTIPEWQGTPLALALVLEDAPPSKAREIGNMLLQTILLP